MIAALSLLAAIAIGPERTLPAGATQPLDAIHDSLHFHSATTTLGEDFVVAWSTPNAVFAQRVDSVTGKPAATTGRLVTLTVKPAEAVAVASIGDRALVVWGGGFSAAAFALLDQDARPVVIKPLRYKTASYISSVAVAAMGNQYLVAWTSNEETDALFVDSASGAPIGSVFTMNRPAGGDNSVTAMASNGSTALLVVGKYSLRTYLITRSGTFTPAALLDPAGGQSPHVVWDGTSYVVCWFPSSDTGSTINIAATDSSGVQTRPTTATFTATGSSALVANGSGCTLFFSGFLSDTKYIRLAAGGDPIDSEPLSLPVDLPSHDGPFGVASAAFNGQRYFVVSSVGGWWSSFEGVLTTLSDRAKPEALSYVAPFQSSPAIAAGHSLFFAGWSESSHAAVVRVRDGLFADAGATAGDGLIALAAENDRAVALTMGSDIAARFVDASGGVSSPVHLDDGKGGPPYSYWLDGVAPIGNGLFLALWTWRGPTGMGSQTYFQHTNAAAFSDVALTGLKPLADTLPYAHSAVAARRACDGIVAYADDMVRIAEIDSQARITGSPLTVHKLSGADFYQLQSIAAASDGADHLLVAVWESSISIYSVDLSTRTVVLQNALDVYSAPHLAWNGSEFILVTDDLTIATFTRDGEEIGEPLRVLTPTPPHDVAIASGPAGTAMVYLRSAADLGVGDVDRLMFRTITEVLPRHHAARP